MKIIRYPARKEWTALLQRPVYDFSGTEKNITAILQDIKDNGDRAVRKYTRKFDKTDISNFRVSDREIRDAVRKTPKHLKESISVAMKNIEQFHRSQIIKADVIETMPGVRCWQKMTPIEKVGLYIPGGSAPLFSSVLMLGIPARLAGCSEIILCTPPDRDGNVHPAILFTANLVGISSIFKVGGIQAVGAMSFGTESIPAVYKIFGPGNRYVTIAKQIVSRQGTAIDMPAGPSEVAIMADHTADPSFIASDILSQAEHGNDSHALLVTNNENIAAETMKNLQKQLKQIPRKDMAEQSLSYSKCIVLSQETEMIDMINAYAPEHLIIAMKNIKKVKDRIINAGSVFLGNYTPVSAGDYASGTNHTLPTNGFAITYSGVNMDSFMKKITFQEITEKGLMNIGPVIEQMAEAESLSAHKLSVSIRIKKIKKR